MTDEPEPLAAPIGGAPVVLPFRVRIRILAYLGALIVLPGLGDPSAMLVSGGGMIWLPISFILKNKLHLPAHAVATFGLVALIPIYIAFLFGFVRDTFNPFGMKDRGFIVLFGAMCSLVYVMFAFAPVTYASILIASLLLGALFLFLMSAQNGLMSTIAGQHVMSGQASAAQWVFTSVLTMAAALAGGALSDQLEHLSAAKAVRVLYLAGGAIMALVALFGFLRPRSVFDNVHAELKGQVHRWDAVKALLSHKPIYIALLIWFVWNFNPGAMTPLLYFVQNKLHGTDGQWGQFNAIVFAAYLPTFVLYGYLCQRFRLKTLLWWGTVIGVPQFVGLAFVHSVSGVLVAGVVIGLTGGIANGAYMDLLIRSCPRGLQGTVLMMAAALFNIAQRIGDVVGTSLYDRSGTFVSCVIAITLTYASILLLLPFVRDNLIDTSDGQVRSPPRVDGRVAI